jgi:hypothetical protein
MLRSVLSAFSKDCGSMWWSSLLISTSLELRLSWFASSFDRIAGSLVECCEKHAIWERHVSEGIDSAVAGLLEVGVTELDESVLASSRCSNINLDQVHLRSQQHRSHVDADTNFPPTQRTNTSDENRERCRLLCLPLQSQPIYRDEVSLRRSSIGVSAPM